MKLFRSKFLSAALAASLACAVTSPAVASPKPNPSQNIILSGTVSAVQGDNATVVLSNGQTVMIHGRRLSVGEQITVRGHYEKDGRLKVEPMPPLPLQPRPVPSPKDIFVTGTVTAINRDRATISLANGQTLVVNAREGARRLTVGQQVTLRGKYEKNGRFKAKKPIYTTYSGPYNNAVSIHGTIVSINGNMIQLARGLSIISVNDSNAANTGAIRGGLYVGRSITVSGSWNGNVFFANSIQ